MTDINTYEIYRSIYQRYRSCKSEFWLVMGEDMVKQARITAEFLNDDNLNKFIELENYYLELRYRDSSKIIHYGSRFAEALSSGRFFFNDEKKLNSSHFNHKKENGIIYICTCSDKKRQLKIGKTTLGLYKRIQMLKKKYNYKDLTVKYAIEVDDVAIIEKKIHELLSDCKVKGNVTGESVEWFYSSIKATKSGILETIKEHDVKILNDKFNLVEINHRLNDE